MGVVRGLGARPIALLLAAASAAILAAAFAFQYLGGLQPCELCIWQRWPYGVAIGLGLATAAAARRGRAGLIAALFALLAVTFAVDAGIAAYHVGVEQHWWAGTAACGGNLDMRGASVEELRRALMAQPVVRCDEVAWSLLGISMAGYNFLAATALAVVAVAAGGRTWRMSKGGEA